jgi:hypothetical protein
MIWYYPKVEEKKLTNVLISQNAAVKMPETATITREATTAMDEPVPATILTAAPGVEVEV